MAQVDGEIVHQALFGYLDGHRLLETSIRLSSRDIYDLSAISDLATGVQLGADESYLTGLTLQESRYFALIRTWPALEMPRPGCVWSHVLILTPEVLASQRDLGALNVLFVRPCSLKQRAQYGRALALSSGSQKSGAPSNLIALVINSYYVGRPSPGGLSVSPALDSAVLAVWSQQWPKLRASFSFRTAPPASLNQGNARFDFQPGQYSDDAKVPATIELRTGSTPSGPRPPLTTRCRPKSRRYVGSSGGMARKYNHQGSVFRIWSKFISPTRTLALHNLPLSWSKSVANIFSGAENAATLKRDMLGLNGQLRAMPSGCTRRYA